MNVLTSQLGFNVYLAYCCCAKDLSYSFLPKEAPCGINKKKSCCSKSTETYASSFKKAPCSKKLVDHKALDAKAQKPVSKDYPDSGYADCQPIPDFGVSFVSPVNTPRPAEPEFESDTGTHLRILYCSWLC
ncbi:MAG TPA: hypothetical protein VFX48_06750 [Saprospiraceae bacterium]|nr:hypothetical protein [Saprospiraceae bacterium]